jgi:hypothetical protein
VLGPAAYDVGLNFLQRWVKQSEHLKTRAELKDVDDHEELALPETWKEFTVSEMGVGSKGWFTKEAQSP